MKSETLNNYRDRINICMKEVSSVYNGMVVTDERYERTSKLFNKCLEMNNLLYGDNIKGDTIEISSRLQSIERSVTKWKGGLPEEDLVTVQDVGKDAMALVSLEPLATPLPHIEGSVKQLGLSKMKDAQQSMLEAHQIFCSEHRVVRSLAEMKALEDYVKGMNPIFQSIIKLDL